MPRKFCRLNLAGKEEFRYVLMGLVLFLFDISMLSKDTLTSYRYKYHNCRMDGFQWLK